MLNSLELFECVLDFLGVDPPLDLMGVDLPLGGDLPLGIFPNDGLVPGGNDMRTSGSG